MIKLDELPRVDENVTENDGKAHFVRIKALMKGGPVVALCGKKFIPKTIADAGEKPTCSKCAELMSFLEMMEQR